ncbi:MAG: PilZ domain-containing protein [Nitrospiraceae bacterium]|nr:PilZ domain-containing protein [Nitrospiraceae bacterium]
MKKILIADTELSATKEGTGILSRADMEVMTAPTSDRALEIHRSERADLVILDLHIEGMSPEEFCTAIRKDTATRDASILITCRENASDIDRAIRCKANDYIPRPFDLQLLMKKVGHLLNISERKSCRVLLKVSVDGKTTGTSFFCTSQNISVSGMLLKTEKILRKGEHIACSFFLPGSERIVAEAEVIRASQGSDGTWHYGIRFNSLSAVYHEAIENFVNARERIL